MNLSRLPLFKNSLYSLLLASSGGILFTLLGLPIPWLLGPLLFCLAATLLAQPVSVPKPLSFPTHILIGAYIGSLLSPELLASSLQWSSSLLVMLLLIVISLLLVYMFYRRIADFDPPTALFSSIPGVFSTVLLLGAAAGAKIPLVTMTQCLRMTLIVVSVPFLVQGLYGGPAILPPQSGEQIISLQDLAILLGGCTALILCLRRLKLPASELACALVVSSLLYGSGTIEGELPNWLLNSALCILGATTGARFERLDRRVLARVGIHGVIATLIAVGLAALFALPASGLAGVSFMASWLAFMPGGIGEICAVASIFDIEPGYVAVHQLLRLFLLIALMSLWNWRSSGSRTKPQATRR